MAKKYIVRNPNGIPQGVHIISYQGKLWYEGDAFAPPKGLNIERLLRQGFIEEVG